MAAGVSRRTFGQTRPPIAPFASYGDPASFTAGAQQQAGDYDAIMKSYGDIAKSALSGSSNPASISPTNIAPQQSQYAQSGDVTKSLSGLKDLSVTGGYTPEGIADIRARDIAPTRSIYANAQQNVERQRALGGGYSPNFNATQAQIARDESNQISDVNVAANAGIAQNVAANRISASGTYAGAAGSANAAQTEADRHNADIVNQINQENATRSQQAGEFNVDARLRAQQAGSGTALAATQGQASLYGTTPALTNTFGNQVVQAGQLGQGQQQLDEQRQRNILSAAGSIG